MTQRRPFTESDDEHLVEYIAKNNPELSGRNGNKLYETLVENPNRWPWSESHPWRSWRERYKKNPDVFDRKIRRYIKEQKAARKTNSTAGPSNKVSNGAQSSNHAGRGAAKRDGSKKQDKLHASKRPSQKDITTDHHEQTGGDTRIPSGSGDQHPQPVPASGQEVHNVSQTEDLAAEEQGPEENIGEDNYMRQLFGSFREENVKPEDPPASSAPSSPTAEKIYPDLQNIPPPNIAQKEPPMHDSLEVTGPPHSTPPKIETKQLLGSIPRLPDRHFEGPPEPEKRMLKRKLPDEDPFIDNTSPTPRQRPAVRNAPPVLKEGPFGNRYVQTRSPTENDSAAWPPNRKRKENAPPPQTTEGNTSTAKVMIGRKVQQQVNAVASSSKVKLLPSTALRPDDPLLIGATLQKPTQQPIPMSKDGEFSLATLSKTQLPAIAVRSDNRTKTIERSRAVGTEQPPPKRQKVRHQETTDSTLASVSSPVVYIPNHSGNARVHKEQRTIRHIDLRSLRMRPLRSGKSSSLSSRSSTTSISHSISNHANRRDSTVSSVSRPQHISNDEDVELMSLFERDLAGLGEQYGFALGVVKQTYLQFGTLEKTVLALRTLNAYMKGAQDRIYEDMQRLFNATDKDHDTDDIIPEGVIPKLTPSKGKGKEKETVEAEGESSLSNKRPRQALSYKPLTTDDEEQTEYSPPSKTRAGRYTKLQKEGREEEALIAASGGTYSRRTSRKVINEEEDRSAEQRQVGMIRRGMEPSSPMSLGSLVPDREPSIGQREDEETEDGDDDDAVEPDGRDRMDVSPDQNEPISDVEQVDDEELELKAEHKKLCSEATLENQDILRAFEEGQDNDRIKKQDWEWIKERISALNETQRLRTQEHQRAEAEKAKEEEE